MTAVPPTFHACAQRSTPEVLALQIDALGRDRAFTELLHCVPDGVLILNECRQILYANSAALALVSLPDPGSAIGKRPGEFLGCAHAADSDGGCGTTRFCRYCGAVNAILHPTPGRATVEECHLLVERAGGQEALDLRVWATPLTFGDYPFTFFAFLDIADEKRKLFLERIFLHDIGNTTTAMKGFLALLSATGQHAPQREHYLHRIDFLSDQILEEIHTQQILIAAEAGDLERHPRELSSLDTLRDIHETYDRPSLLNGRNLALAKDCEEVAFVSDPALVARVLGNMVKNAIEASTPGERVTLHCERHEGEVRFHVHNPTYMPENIRLQVFNRSFSTKGAGRGLGTYSMKFLTEHFLGGRIFFTSSESSGTRFSACYPLAFPQGV
jgi:signal transduction histidine kinase